MIDVRSFLRGKMTAESILDISALASARAEAIERLERELEEERAILELIQTELRRRAPEKFEISLVGFAEFLKDHDLRLLELFESCQCLDFSESKLVLEVAKENRAFFSIFQPALESALKLYAGKTISIEPRFK